MNKQSIQTILITAVLLLLSISAQAVDNLGQLLTTPQERVQIQQWRTQSRTDDTSQTGIDPQADVTQSTIRFNGMLLRSDGRSSQWVNGQWIDNDNKAQILGITDKPDPLQGLGIIIEDENTPDKTQIIYIKPGQIYDRTAGEVIEAYRQEPITAITTESIDQSPDETDKKKKSPTAKEKP